MGMKKSYLFLLSALIWLFISCCLAAKGSGASSKSGQKTTTSAATKTYTHNPRPVFSSRRCVYSDTQQQPQHAQHKNNKKVDEGESGVVVGHHNYASCELKNVCYNYKESKWEYHSQKGRTKEGMPSPLLHLGGYASSPTLTLNVVDTPMHYSDQEAKWLVAPVVLYQGVSHLYMHWLLDDMFGLWWLQREWKLLHREGEVEVLWMGKKGKWVHTTIEDTKLFSEKSVRELDSFSKHSQGPTEGRDRVCFKQLYAGPSGYHLGGPGVSQVFKQPHLVREFSDYFLSRAGLPVHSQRQQQQHSLALALAEPTLTVVVRESGAGRQILNIKDLKEHLKLTRPNLKVNYLNLADLSLAEQLKVLSETTILMGVHGSGLANLVFLPQDASVIQLFPYKFYRPTYNYIGRLAGVKILEWKNDNKDNTVFHPEILDSYPALSNDEKEEIKRNPDTTSTKWAANMYWISQDTILDVAAIDSLIDQALSSGIHLTMKQQAQQAQHTKQTQQPQGKSKVPPMSTPLQGAKQPGTSRRRDEL